MTKTTLFDTKGRHVLSTLSVMVHPPGGDDGKLPPGEPRLLFTLSQDAETQFTLTNNSLRDLRSTIGEFLENEVFPVVVVSCVECGLLNWYDSWKSDMTQDEIGGGYRLDGKSVPIRKIDDVDGPLIGFTCRDELTGELFEDTVGYDCAHIRDEEFVRYLDGEITEW